MPTAADELIPPPTRNPFGIGFKTPAGPPLSPLPSPATSPENPEDLDETSGGPELDSDEWDAATFPENLDGTSSPASTPDVDEARVDLFDEEDLTTLARGSVAFAGEKAHELIATTPGKQHVGLMRTDEQDQAQIGDPLARIAARHSGDLGGKVNPDTKDFLSSLVGLFGYGLKQINKVSEARAIDAGAGNPQPIPTPARDL